MRFMMLVIPKGYETAEPGTIPDAEGVTKMMKFNRKLHESGVLRAMDGLHPPSMGARVSYVGGKPKVTDGPFAEAKEVLGGYWLIEVPSKEDALDWAKQAPMGETEIIEVRQAMDFEDFPDDVQKAADGYREMKEAADARRES